MAAELRKEALTFTADETKSANWLMLSVLEAVYQFERKMVLERQHEGIAKAQRAESTGVDKTALTAKPSRLALIRK